MVQLEFEKLSAAQKTEVIYERAVYLAKRRAGAEAILLFQLEGFYIEVFYLSYRLLIKRIESFRALTRLEPYLKQIELKDVVPFTG